MQKLMKSLIVAFAYMSMPIMAQKTDLVNPIIGTNGMGHTFPIPFVPMIGFTRSSEQTGWDIHFPAPALRLVSYK